MGKAHYVGKDGVGRYLRCYLGKEDVVKIKLIAGPAGLVALTVLGASIPPASQAWENSLPWCLVSDSGSVNQCFSTKDLCMKEAEKQNKICVFVPPKK